MAVAHGPVLSGTELQEGPAGILLILSYCAYGSGGHAEPDPPGGWLILRCRRGPGLRSVPELVLRHRPVLFDIVPEEVVLPLPEVVGGQGFWFADERVQEIFFIPRVPA